MAAPGDRVIVIGAGHNGLVAAAYLAKAGFRPLVLERREVLGGGAVTEELRPGFRCPTLAHSTGPLLPGLVDDLGLAGHGLTFLTPEVRLFAPCLDGDALHIYEDPRRTADELGRLSPRDAERYPKFLESFSNIGRVLAPLLKMTPPDIDHPTAGDFWDFGRLGLRFRGLAKKDAFRLLRWGPMAVADLAAEWFETELLRALIEARGVRGTFAGPLSAGTSLNVLMQAALDGSAFAAATFVKGGMGALSEALASAARAAGSEIRAAAPVERVRVEGNKVKGVRLVSGEEIDARMVVSNADPRNTFLRLVDPVDLDPNFLMKIGNYRSRGSAAKVNLALSGLPDFSVQEEASLTGRIHIGPSTDYLERAFDAAKYGDFSPKPCLDVVIPSLADPTLAPEGAHVMSIYAQYAPYELKDGDWPSRREALGDTVVATLSAYAPNLAELVVERQVLTPVDLEQTFGLSGGHVGHGEPSLDQMFTFRPLLGWSRYRTPIDGLYLCGAGTHPGGGITGAPGLNASREILADLKNGF